MKSAETTKRDEFTDIFRDLFYTPSSIIDRISIYKINENIGKLNKINKLDLFDMYKVIHYFQLHRKIYKDIIWARKQSQNTGKHSHHAKNVCSMINLELN